MSFVQPSAKLSLCVFVLCNLRLFVFQLQKWKKLKRVYCFALCAASKRLRCPTCQSVLKLTVARLFIHLFDAWLFHLRVMVWNWNWLRLKICLIFHTVISHKKKNLLKHFVCSDMRDTVLLPSCQTVSLTCIWVETTLDLLHRYLVMLLLNLLKEPEVLKVIEGCLWPNKVVTKLECAAPSRYWGLFRNGAASLLWRRNCCDAVASSFTAPHSACSSWTQPSTRTPAPRGQTHTK